MKKQWQAFYKEYWTLRSREERRLILFALWLLTPLLFYTVLWQPAHAAVQKLRGQLPSLHAQLETMRADATAIRALRRQAQPAPIEAAAIKDVVEASALRNQLKSALTSIELQPPSGVRVTLAEVPFDKLLFWLKELQQEQLLRADVLSVSALPQEGMVRVSATLVSGGGQ